MGLFGQKKPDAPSQALKYSLVNVQTLLEDIGQSRLHVIDPKLKVLLTSIAQNGEAFLGRLSPAGTPSESDIMDFQGHLEAVSRVVQQYVEIQDDFNHPERSERLQEGFEAVDGFASRVLSNATPGGSQSMTNFRVDTKILSAQRLY